MSEGMIIRRGGGGGGFDPTGAILKVVTSAGCTVNVSGTSYSRTQTDAEGFPRSGDANVVEHFFNIPSTAFGTITVTATNTYGTNTKTLTVNTAGKVYEQLCGGLNIILDSTFGLQSGLALVASNYTYVDRDKEIVSTSYSINPNSLLFSDDINITPYSQLTVAFGTHAGSPVKSATVSLIDEGNTTLARLIFSDSEEKTGSITNKYYPTAKLHCSGEAYSSSYRLHITKIVLS